MRKDTKEVIDEIIEQWCENKLSVSIMIDNDGCNIYTITKNNQPEKGFRRRLSDRFENQGKKINEDQVVCRIAFNMNAKEPLAAITFKSQFSVDNDMTSIYKYLERFLAVVRSKVRQMNCWGIKVKLGLMDLEEFDDMANIFCLNL